MQRLDPYPSMSHDMAECIQNCLDCYSSCVVTVPHCLKMGGEHASQTHITTLLECAELCQTSANLMLMKSSRHFDVCGICAKACEACAAECEAMAGDDRQMLACAAVCRECAKSCKQMAVLAH
ncbi:MAG: four-helix bundle copper-binding protein [Chloroflexi bacterium]|nr:four-helix bundle copper-binding protein [Chloroflexota bacterium]MCC6892579.1 four-helix bundle copper-binding protein [Anaerolineae bacterium]